MEQCKYDVFISYSRKDLFNEKKEIIPGNEISEILKALDSANITYWYDRKGFSGEKITKKITQNIRSSRLFVFLSTHNSNYNSKWTPKELSLAVDLGKYIIPVRIDQSPYSDEIMMNLSDIDFIDYHTNPQIGRDDLINAINKQLENKDSEIPVMQDNKPIENDTSQSSADESSKSEIKKDESEKRSQNSIIKNKTVLYAIISCLALIPIGYLLFHHLSEPTPMPETETEPLLVFSGGGSVYNYILDHPIDGKIIDLRNYDNAIYINQPSGNAWTLLIEEAIYPQRIKFCSICLSADMIDSTYMVNKNNALETKARIVQLLIGHDPLMVYCSKELASSILVDTNTKYITLKRLYEIINDTTKAFRLFSTSSNSGTLRTYQHYISTVDTSKTPISFTQLIDNELCFPFYEDATSDYMLSLNDLKNSNMRKYFFALGSKYYKPKGEGTTGKYDSIPLMYVIKGEKDSLFTLTKPIYIYFIATTDKNNDEHYLINNRIIDFLKQIDAKYYIDKTHWNNIINGGYVISQGSIIIPINDTTSQLYQTEQERLRLLSLPPLRKKQ